MDRELILSFIDRAYSTAFSHGFHDVELSDAHFLMLVVSEIGEMVEADRKNLRANPEGFEKCVGLTYNDRFKNYVKDSVEDELADVCIRLFDFCGTRGLEPLTVGGQLIDMDKEFGDAFGGYTLCEQAFVLCDLVMDVARTKIKSSVENALGSVFSFILAFARHHGIDLVWHVEKKMEYNESRAKMHGKGY